MSFLDTLMTLLEGSTLDRGSLPAAVPALVAAGSLVAFADGAADPAELREVDRAALARSLGRPGAAEDIRMVLDRHADNFDRGLGYGRAHAIAVLEDWGSATDAERDAVMRAALEVGRAQDGLSALERDAAREVARALGLDPARYGL